MLANTDLTDAAPGAKEYAIILPVLLLAHPSERNARCELGHRTRDPVRDSGVTGRLSTRRKFAAISVLNGLAFLPVFAFAATLAV